MNKAPSLGKTPPAGLRGRQHQWFSSKSTSISPPSTGEWNEQQSSPSENLDTNSSTTISGDLGQHRMVVAIDYGTTFSGKREETFIPAGIILTL